MLGNDTKEIRTTMHYARIEPVFLGKELEKDHEHLKLVHYLSSVIIILSFRIIFVAKIEMLLA